MNGEDFQQFLIEELAPKLWSGAVVVMDNLPAQKVKGVARCFAPSPLGDLRANKLPDNVIKG